MEFQFTPTTPAEPRKVRLTIPEDLAAWVESEAKSKGGNFDALVVQAIQFARDSQARHRTRTASKNHPEV
jgi:hypothetical protein